MRKARRYFELVLLMVLPLMLPGCATNRHNFDLTAVPLAPQPPPILLSATAKLIKLHPAGFTANVEMELSGTGAQKTGLRGKIYCDGTNVLFRPDDWQKPKKFPGGFSFIWTAKANTGFILCEPLQGYAPMDEFAFPTDSLTENVSPGTGGSASNNYSISQHGNDFLVKVSERDSLNLVRFTSIMEQRPSDELFQPPPGFAFYANRSEMMYEFSVRNGSGFVKKRSFDLPDAGDVVMAAGQAVVAAGYLFLLLFAHPATQ